MKSEIIQQAIIIFIIFVSSACAQVLPDINGVETDLIVPAMVDTTPSPGIRAKVHMEKYSDTNLYHALYLPTNWEEGKKYPVIFEYPGNGPYKNKFGDTNSGRLEDCNLGYGISGGEGFIWVCLPFVAENQTHQQLYWWGDREKTVLYLKAAVKQVCKTYGGNSSKLFLAGFSRGAIACNYIGLHDDEVAALWAGMIVHSHYDGLRKWNYPESDSISAVRRLKRLGQTPQFISDSGYLGKVRDYLEKYHPEGSFIYCVIPFRNHTDSWVLKDIPQRTELRNWIRSIISGE